MADNGYRVYESDEDALTAYHHHVAEGRKHLQTWEAEAHDGWRRYRLDPSPSGGDVTPQGHRVTVGAGVGNIDSMFSALTAVEVDIAVHLTGTGTEEMEEVAEGAIRYVWRSQKVMRKARRAIKDSLVVGIGWLKVSYDYSEHVETRERDIQDVRADNDTVIQAALDNDEAPPSALMLAQLIPTEEDVEVVDRDRVVVDYVPWNELLWDPTAKDVDDLRWVCQVTKVPRHEVVNNPAFKEYCAQTGHSKDLKELKGDVTLRVELTDADYWSSSDQSDLDDAITLLEFWDFTTGMVCTFTPGAKFMLNKVINPLAFHDDIEDRNPFVGLVLRADGERVLGISDMHVLAPTLDEMELYRSALANFTDRFVPKVLAPEGVFEEDAKAAMRSREYGEIVEYARAITNSPDAVKPFTPPTLPAEVFQVYDKLLNEARENTGVNELLRGQALTGRHSASEVQQMAAASASRQAEKRDAVGGFFLDVARRILWFMQLFYEQEQIDRIVDIGGPIEWTWTNEDISGELDLEVSLTPKKDQSAEQDMNDALALLNILAPLAQFVDITYLLEHLLRKMRIPRKVIAKILKNQEDQQVEKQQALQDQAAQGQVAAGGTPDPALVPGPMDAASLADAANQGGTVPEEVAAGVAGVSPASESGLAALLSG